MFHLASIVHWYNQYIMKPRELIIALACVSLIFMLGAGQATVAQGKLFADDDLLEVELRTDIRNLLRNKANPEYQEAEVIINNKSYDIRLKARGNYRRENCHFPPVTLNFSKTEFDDPTYDQLKKLKLVNACKMQKNYEQYILREYMIYKAFNLLTDKSFKVRLLRINYIDTREKMKPISRYGFVIEDQYIMAKRLDGAIIKKEGIRDKATARNHMVMLSIFHFMMGNTDWQVARLHNVKLIQLNDVKQLKPYVVPYDFDYTGMVNASYAIPSPILGIETLRDRLFWGKCYEEQELKTAIDIFIAKKESLYALYENFEWFDKASRASSIDYLDSFYDIVENEKRWKHHFIFNCQQ